MIDVATGELRVVVPVGFLLAEQHEVTVSVDLPAGRSLPIRLQLVPARVSGTTATDPTPVSVGWPTPRYAEYDDDGYPEYELGGEN